MPAEAADSIIGARRVDWEIKPSARSPHVGVEKIERKKLNQSVAAFVAGLYDTEQPILCVCSTRDNSRTLARAIAARMPEKDLTEHLKLAIDLIDSKYPFYKPLREMLARGVAYHNSAVPAELRVLIEEAVKHKELAVVAATTTLAEGVDLPFRYTIIVDWLTYSAQGKTPIKGQLLKNIAGRCGRAGVYTEGDTIVVDNPIGEARFTTPSIRSKILGDVIFKPTDHLGSALGIAVDGGIEEGKAELSSQFLAAIQENPDAEDLARTFANHTYARFGNVKAVRDHLIATTDDLLSTAGGLALAARNSPLRLTPLGLAANRSGFSASSARVIMAFVNSKRTFPNLPALSAELLRRFGTLPEQPSVGVRDSLGNSRSHFPVKPDSYAQVTFDWITGVPPHEGFARLPNLIKSKREIAVSDWSAGVKESLDWEAIFDKYVEFLATQLEEYLPRLMVACELYGEHFGGWSQDIDWKSCREALAERNSYWAT